MSRFRNAKASFTGRDALRAIDDAHREYCTTVEGILNDAIVAEGLDCEIEIETGFVKMPIPLREQIAREVGAKTPLEVITSLPGAMAYPDKGKVVAAVLSLLDSTSHIALEAETQFGKTITSVASVCIRTLINYKNENREMIAIVNPNKNMGAEQTDIDLASFIDLHGGMHLKGERNYSLRGAVEDGYVRSFKRSREHEVEAIIEAARKGDFETITLVTDEGDEATSKTSILAKWCNQLRAEGFDVRLLLVSATSYPYRDLGFSRHRVPIAEDSGYCGTVAGRRTPVVGYSRLAKHLGIPALADFTLAEYRSNILSDDPKKRRIAKAQAEMLAETIVKSCLHAPVGLGFNGLRFNGGKYGMARVGAAAVTDHFLRFATPILKKAGIAVLEYFSTNMKRDGKPLMIEDWLHEQPGHAIIVMKGAGRRQDRFPADCTMAFDFTDFFSTTVAMEQGTMGRMSGWNKITEDRSTMVVLSDENEEMVSLFRKDYDFYGVKVPRGNPGSNSVILEDYLPRDTKKGHVEIDFSRPEYCHLTGLRDALNDLLAEHAFHRTMNGKNGQTFRAVQLPYKGDDTDLVRKVTEGRKKGYAAFAMDAVLTPFYDDIHAAMRNAGINASILRPIEGSVNPVGLFYPTIDGTFVEIDVRNSQAETTGGVQQGGNAARHSKPNGASKNNRPTLQGRYGDKNASNLRRVMISFNFQNDKPVVDVVNFMTATDYVVFDQSHLQPDERTGPIVVGPNKNSMFGQMAA